MAEPRGSPRFLPGRTRRRQSPPAAELRWEVQDPSGEQFELPGELGLRRDAPGRALDEADHHVIATALLTFQLLPVGLGQKLSVGSR